MLHSWQQELDREREAMQDEDLQREESPEENRHLMEERDAPMLELSVTIRLLEGRRTSSGMGNRSCPPIARGVGGGLQGVGRDHFDSHAKERTQEGKSVLSLRGAAEKALEAASAWALSRLGAAWRVLKTASSWSKAQGALARVLWGSRIGAICQVRKEPGQREREAAPGSPI